MSRGSGRSAAALGQASQHANVRELFARIRKEQAANALTYALLARPPQPFDVAAFDERWLIPSEKDGLEKLVFDVLYYWALARPCEILPEKPYLACSMFYEAANSSEWVSM